MRCCPPCWHPPQRGRPGHISLVSSVAGFRGLPKRLAYGPTKAALINLAETLYLDLHDLGVGVSVVHPGFVDTPLTASNDFRMPALITPATAAARAFCAAGSAVHSKFTSPGASPG